MYVQKTNSATGNMMPYFYRKNTDNTAFCHAANLSIKQQSKDLVNKYLKNLASEKQQFLLEGNTILQPEAVPVSVLKTIAENALNQMKKFPKNHILYIVTGRIGGGKSAFVEQNNFQELFYTPDADKIKPLLPGYNQHNASYVHKVSCVINSTNISEALKRGIDTIIQTATTIDNLDDIIDEARDHNYSNIVMIHIDTNEENAIKRAMERGELTGRKIDPKVIKERTYIDNIVPTYKSPFKGLSQLVVYNNNGSHPIKEEDINFSFLPEVLTYVTDTDK